MTAREATNRGPAGRTRNQYLRSSTVSRLNSRFAKYHKISSAQDWIVKQDHSAWATHKVKLSGQQLARGRVVVRTEKPKPVHLKQTVTERFRKLADAWKTETAIESSTMKLVTNHNYQKIIALGYPAVPLILEELRHEPLQWFWALRMITDQDPAEGTTSTEAAAEAWLQWGRRQGY